MTFLQGLQQCTKNTNADTALIACSREVVALQLQSHSTADLMDAIATSSIPRQYGGCHGVAHIIGEETYAKYNSVEKAALACTGSCYGGCLHGVIAGAVVADFGASDPGVDIVHMDVGQIEKIGAKYCSNIALCHGLGHILYYVTNDFQKASEACGEISKGFPHEMCVSGTFMQGVGDIHNSLALSDSSSPQPPKPNGDYAYPCDTVSPPYQHQCFLYLPEYQLYSFQAANVSDTGARFKIAEKNCERQTGAARSSCFEGMGYNAFTFASVQDDYITPVVAMCKSLPTLSDQKSCVLGFVEISIGYGYDRQAYDFCPALSSPTLRTFCYFANFSSTGPKTAPTAETACQYASAKDQCTAAYSIYESERATLPDYRFGLYGKTP